MPRRSFGHIRKLPSKRYQASYVSDYNKRTNAPHTFLTRADASAWLASEEVRIRRGGEEPVQASPALAKSSPTFEEFMERHIALQTTGHGSLLKASTKDLYSRLLRVNLKSFWGRKINEICVADVNEWWAHAIAGGKRTSASKAYKLLSAGMKRAVQEGYIASNPCLVKGAQGAITGKVVNVPTLEEVRMIAKNINSKYSKMIILMAFSGLRFGEVTELRRKDVIEVIANKRRTYSLRVERAVTLVSDSDGKKGHKVDKPKSRAGIRDVILPSGLAPIVEAILSETPKSRESLLFRAATGENKHLRHDVFMNSWRRALKKSGIPDGKYAPHCLRHFAGSHLHKAGATIPELKEWLGDSSTAAVMRYVHSTGRTAGIVDGMLSRSFSFEAG